MDTFLFEKEFGSGEDLENRLHEVKSPVSPHKRPSLCDNNTVQLKDSG
jgi:hypothetical protein